MIRILFVCLGNICRSPLAEGVFRHRVSSMGLCEGDDGDVLVDSAGTGSWHCGSPPDARSIKAAERHQIDITRLRARTVDPEDFELFDYIVAMDRDNLQALIDLCPEDRRNRLYLLMDFVEGSRIKEVPDPFHFRDDASYQRIYATIAEGIDGLIAHLHKQGLLHKVAS